MGGRSRALAVALFAISALVGFEAGAEAHIAFYGSTGLGLDGLKGYLGGGDLQERIVIETDEAPVHLLFFWDSPSLDPWVTVADGTGTPVGEYQLRTANRIVFGRPGRYVLVLAARSGEGRWFCVLLGSREWDTR